MSQREPYGVLLHRFWEGKTGRQIQAKGKDAVILAAYLVSCRHANMIGLYELPMFFLERELTVLDSRRSIEAAFADLECVEFAKYDPETEYAWVREMARIRTGLAHGEVIKSDDNRHKAIVRLYAAVRPNPFSGEFHQYYRTTLRLQAEKVSTVRQQVFHRSKPEERETEGACKGGGEPLQGTAAVSGSGTGSGTGTTAAAPRDHAREPNDNGNFKVIHRLALDLLEKESFESEGDLREAVKCACAANKIDYGAHPDVDVDVIARACSSAIHRHKSRQVASRPRQRARV